MHIFHPSVHPLYQPPPSEESILRMEEEELEAKAEKKRQKRRRRRIRDGKDPDKDTTDEDNDAIPEVSEKPEETQMEVSRSCDETRGAAVHYAPDYKYENLSQ